MRKIIGSLILSFLFISASHAKNHYLFVSGYQRDKTLKNFVASAEAFYLMDKTLPKDFERSLFIEDSFIHLENQPDSKILPFYVGIKRVDYSFDEKLIRGKNSLSDIQKFLEDVFYNDIKPNEKVIIHFRGHGGLNSNNESFFSLSSGFDEKAGENIYTEDLRKLVKIRRNEQNNNIIFIFEECYSGGLLDMVSLDDGFEQNVCGFSTTVPELTTSTFRKGPIISVALASSLFLKGNISSAIQSFMKGNKVYSKKYKKWVYKSLPQSSSTHLLKKYFNEKHFDSQDLNGKGFYDSFEKEPMSIRQLRHELILVLNENGLQCQKIEQKSNLSEYELFSIKKIDSLMRKSTFLFVYDIDLFNELQGFPNNIFNKVEFTSELKSKIKKMIVEKLKGTLELEINLSLDEKKNLLKFFLNNYSYFLENLITSGANFKKVNYLKENFLNQIEIDILEHFISDIENDQFFVQNRSLLEEWINSKSVERNIIRNYLPCFIYIDTYKTLAGLNLMVKNKETKMLQKLSNILTCEKSPIYPFLKMTKIVK